MYNFLDPRLLPKVNCDSPCTDTYEPSNLIHESDMIRSRGFLAYTIIKPPVELVFEFLCPIEIHYVSLVTTIGRQKCSGIELFAKDEKGAFVSIAKGIYNSSGVTFCDAKKCSKKNFVGDQALFYFKRDTFRVFTNTVELKLVIFRTERCVPCLASIKVYGNPSKSCSNVTLQTIKRLINGSEKTKIRDPPKQEFSIPEDFLDALTYEMMAIPMTLPSGKTIDRETLEKHNKNEEVFKRQAGDPFTGLKFTETRKPVVNVALKSRIDMFLVQNSDNPKLRGVKRTLGSTSSEKKCACCDNANVYVLSCQHYFCRMCLFKLKNFCKVCSTEFKSNEVERVY